jgi:hypothetical protein
MRSFAIATFLIAAAGCVGGDALHDASPNTSLDSGPKLRLDASANPAADAGLKPSPDANIDAALDAASDAAAFGCRNALPLQCGDRRIHSTTTHGLANEFSTYGCTQRAETGRETIYAFSSNASCRVSVRLSELQTDLDLFVLDACDVFMCTQSSSTPLDLQKGERVSFDAHAGSRHAIVVDGYSGSVGSYALEVSCLCGTASSSFSDGAWQLQVDRHWNGDLAGVLFPEMALDEDDYEPVADAAPYDMLVSDGWHFVSIGTAPSLGELSAGATSTLHYELTKGTFAGGRFLVWVTPNGLEAELTIYGSGVPIISSERGRLIRKP